MATKPNGTPSLEQRVAAALQDDSLNSTQLSNLFDDLETAIPAAQAAAEQARAAAEDPLQTTDLHAAQQAIELTALRRDRLKSLLPRLQARCAEVVYAAEQDAAWAAKYDATRPISAALAAELAEVYPAIVGRLIDLLARSKAADAALRAVCDVRPVNYRGGDGRDLVMIEQLARGMSGSYFGNNLSLKEHLRLPKFPDLSGQPAYPPFKVPFAVEAAVSSAQMAEHAGDPRLYGPDWHLVKPEQEARDREAAAQAEAERQRQWEEANPNVPKWYVQGAQP